MYFECNLPKLAPKHIKNTQVRRRVNTTLRNIHARMDKLETALNLSGMRGEQFAEGAKLLFNEEDAVPVLDTMSAEALADTVMALARDIKHEPRIEWPNADVVVDTAFLKRTEWEEIRMIGLGGSDAAVTLGVSPYRTALALYHDKIGTEYEIDKVDPGLQFIFQYGHCVEDLVISEFCRRSGARRIPETRMFSKKGMPFITANIDGILEVAGSLVVFEAKTTTHFNREAWDDKKVPVQYVPQCRQYMAVLDDPRIKGTYIGCIFGNTPSDFACSFIERSLTEEQIQLDTEQRFWTEHVLAHVTPDMCDNPKENMDILRRIAGPTSKDVNCVNLNKDDTAIIEEYLSLNEKRKALEKQVKGVKEQQDALAVQIVEELGNVVKGVLPKDDTTVYEVSYAPRSKTTVDKERLLLAFPDAYSATVTTEPESTRVFSIKERRIMRSKNAA